MKKHLLFFATFLFYASAGFAQKAPASPRITVESDLVTVAYGQPSKNGRIIFGDLVPYGKIWRAGANNATEITFKKNVTFGGTKVKAGTYSLFVIPTKSEWSFILNPNLKQWGAFGYNKIKKDDIAVVTVKPTSTSAPVEKMTFNVSDNSIDLMWDDTKASVPLNF